MSSSPHGVRVLSLAPASSRWRSFSISFITQAIGLVLLVHFGVIQPKQLLDNQKSYQITTLVAPSLTPVTPPVTHPPRIQAPSKPELNQIAPKTKTSPPQLQLPTQKPVVAEASPAAPPKVEAPQPRSVEAMFPSAKAGEAGNGSPKRDIKTDAFSSGSSAVATLNKSPREVQTGGFGDPNGVPANANAHGPANIAKVGSFDLPSGPGEGNGYGGAKGATGTVASAGFGDGVAGSGGSGHGSGLGKGGSVREGGFGDGATAVAVKETSAKVERKPQEKAVPAEILSKPTPAYTDEARQQKIEGEVLLEVQFSASGKVHVLRVLRGLGHGLDEAAVRAAEHIQFKPAQRDGQPVDSTGKLHIIFQLA